MHTPESYMITGPQIRAARALLRMSAATLGQKAGLSRPTIERAEAANDVPEMRTHTLLAIQRALEGSGIVFIDPGEQKPGGHGVRFSPKP